MRSNFKAYFDYVLRWLATPEAGPRQGESWQEHDARLAEKRVRLPESRCYSVHYNLVNCADYRVPQSRLRVFVVAIRGDQETPWTFPVASHTKEALRLTKQTGEYSEEHGLRPRGRRAIVDRLPPAQRWRTVRDALKGLPDPRDKDATGVSHHVFVPGARGYVGHTGSVLDEPAKALKARDHGNPGGENMLRNERGHVRYFTMREAARIQTYPDDYVFAGSRSEAMRQLGNAVPVRMACAIGKTLYATLDGSTREAPARDRQEPTELKLPFVAAG